ncbi:MAG TPA: CPBP family intramembrane glutamic endopeptidase [Gemmatimonadales bacterium]|nr:CPBP family intramembrane glutamic endopeptidase [Gemmatimonadales bacterium]
MLPTSNLSTRERIGLVIAIVALQVGLSPLNLHFRVWLRDTVVGGAPFWADHLLFMMTLMVVVWAVIGYLILGRDGLFLGRPERPREAWWMGIVTGFILTAVVAGAVAILGPLVIEWHPNYPVMFANFVSNWYEEFVFRGVILALLLRALGNRPPWIAATISTLLFLQGHLTYPPVLLAAVFIGGYLWAWMTIRYRSLWPAWLSHTVADTIADALIKL